MTAPNAVRERPILYSGPMVREILERRKTQTRRVMVPQPNPSLDYVKGRTISRFRCVSLVPPGKPGYPEWQAEDHTGPIDAFPDGRDSVKAEIGCPYGAPGDRLWVRETWGCPEADHPRAVGGRKPAQGDRLVYAANPSDAYQWRGGPGCSDFVWRPSIHMPRWASRITLEVTDIRAQRLQEISEEDAIAEGMLWQEPTDADREWARQRFEDGESSDPTIEGVWIAPGTDNGFSPEGHREKWATTARDAFRLTWDAINGTRGLGWEANPWVWCVSFEVLR